MEPVFFADAAELRAWFEKHHADEPELIVGYYKTHTGRRGMTWSEAVDQALCFGWIDGVGRRIDADRHQQRFTPRRKGSIWSAVNVAKVEALTAAGLMHPAGLKAFAERREDRTGVYSHEQKSEAALTAEQEALFRAAPGAWEWFGGQAPSYRRAAAHWVTSAKREETREKRLTQLIADAAEGRRVAPLSRR
jgi:uncharacterized protein YdeI (YjbR/CyaY-like superfamily)